MSASGMGFVDNCATHRAGIAMIAATMTTHRNKNVVRPRALKRGDVGIDAMFGLVWLARDAVVVSAAGDTQSECPHSHCRVSHCRRWTAQTFARLPSDRRWPGGVE